MRSGAFLDDTLEDNSAQLEASADMSQEDVASDSETPRPAHLYLGSDLSVYQELMQIRSLLTV